MADVDDGILDPAEQHERKSRPLCGTEQNWCRAVLGGTGITVLALVFAKPPDTSNLQHAFHKLQISHPILRSRITQSEIDNTLSFTTTPAPHLLIQSFDVSTTSDLLQNLPDSNNHLVSPFHLILEHELNQNPWSNQESSVHSDTDIFFASLYALPDTKWVLALRLHTVICDRTSAVSLLRELVVLTGEKEGEEVKWEEVGEAGLNLGIEDLIPSGKAKKPFWASGLDLLGYSLNSLRFSNLEFKDAISPRSSQVVRLQMNPDETNRVLAECKGREIKLCAALAAAGLIAAHSSKHLPDHRWEKYAVITLVDCRSILDPPVQPHHLGFYHSAILNTHDVKGGEDVWELARRCNMSLRDSINSNKHFSDMGDLNFLMCKAIDNPGLTPSSSLRTCLISVFEDLVIDYPNQLHQQIGLEDYMGCASVHGVGPSIAIFDTIRDGRLDCAFVYPSPLHSREQMQELIDNMKSILMNDRD